MTEVATKSLQEQISSTKQSLKLYRRCIKVLESEINSIENGTADITHVRFYGSYTVPPEYNSIVAELNLPKPYYLNSQASSSKASTAAANNSIEGTKNESKQSEQSSTQIVPDTSAIKSLHNNKLTDKEISISKLKNDNVESKSITRGASVVSNGEAVPAIDTTNSARKSSRITPKKTNISIPSSPASSVEKSKMTTNQLTPTRSSKRLLSAESNNSGDETTFRRSLRSRTG